jgi:hypothetical protein
MARIAGIDLPKNKRGVIGLTYIYGIGRSLASEILAKAGIDENKKVQDWTDDEQNTLRTIINDEYKVEGAPVNGKPEFAIYHTVDATAPVGTYDVEIFSGTITTLNVEYIAPKLIVEPAPVTITAKSYTRKYGEPNPEFELTYRSFRNREKAEDVLTKQPVIECDATETSPAGDYEIRVSGAEAQNYVFEYVAGVLTIEDDPSGVDLQRARTADGSTFDLQGRKMKNAESSTSQLPKGVYIRNGKKVVIK